MLARRHCRSTTVISTTQHACQTKLSFHYRYINNSTCLPEETIAPLPLYQQLDMLARRNYRSTTVISTTQHACQRKLSFHYRYINNSTCLPEETIAPLPLYQQLNMLARRNYRSTTVISTTQHACQRKLSFHYRYINNSTCLPEETIVPLPLYQQLNMLARRNYRSTTVISTTQHACQRKLSFHYRYINNSTC